MTSEAPTIKTCTQCGTQIAPTMLACPLCGRLVHADLLATLAQSAREATNRGDASSALASWREALDLLPKESKQFEVIAAKITELGQSIPAGPISGRTSDRSQSTAAQAATGVGAIGLMLWKFKAILLGLTKGTTLFSMLLSLGVYWSVWGWKFALGIVLSIYVHEMGHVIVLRRYGFKATAPMFVPGLGALIRLQQHVVNPREDAEIGLAGPVYGLGAAMVALAIWYFTRLPIFAAIAGVGAWINLFNLLPISTLDGGRGFHAMSRLQKFAAAATAAAAWYFTDDGLLLLLGLVCLGRAFSDKSEKSGSLKAAATYCFLIVVLSALSMARLQAGVETP